MPKPAAAQGQGGTRGSPCHDTSKEPSWKNPSDAHIPKIPCNGIRHGRAGDTEASLRGSGSARTKVTPVALGWAQNRRIQLSAPFRSLPIAPDGPEESVGVFPAFKGLVKILAAYWDLLETLGREQPGVVRFPLGPRSKSSTAKTRQIARTLLSLWGQEG